MDALFTPAGAVRGTLPLDVLAALTLLGLAPFILILTTSFVRIVVVLSLVRSAIGAATLPPNAVLTGLALVLTIVVMSPTAERIDREALQPYAAGRLTQRAALERGAAPLRAFMLRQAKRRDIDVFARLARRPTGEDPSGVPPAVLIPAFVVGELRSAFAIGVAL